jgi:predicted Zn-ribbon and HTH transcriptional regulator
MTAGRLAEILSMEPSDLALGADAFVSILADGTVNATERGVLIADVMRLDTRQRARVRRDVARRDAVTAASIACPACHHVIEPQPHRCKRCRARFDAISPPARCPRCDSRYWQIPRGTLKRGRPRNPPKVQA